ncbi:MAG: hypothetical protein HRU24_03520 [Gammaproteobacteria bacterium]|nr:hypothetical protein [Gammaproteobacteria bacterium]
MSGFDSEHVASLLRQLGQHDQLIAQAYVQGYISSDDSNVNQLSSLHKSGILRPDEDAGDYRTSADIKQMLNRLMRQQRGYRQMSDMGKVINALSDSVTDYRDAIEQQQLDDADYYLEQLDDLLYDTKDSFSGSLDNMHYAITSQFGFVSTLSAKVRENEKALNYAQKLLLELKQIDPNVCYQWIDWACPSELARKVTGFIEWFHRVLDRLAHIIDKMRVSLFRLRQDEKQANQLRGMARYLRAHPEFEIDPQLYDAEHLPQQLKFSPPLPLRSYVDVRNTGLESDLIEIVQSLRKASVTALVKERDSCEISVEAIEEIAYDYDFFEQQVELLFEHSIINNVGCSALEYWQQHQPLWQQQAQDMAPKSWIELVFSCYCKLTNDQQQGLTIHMKGRVVDGTNNNFTFTDVVIEPNGD